MTGAAALRLEQVLAPHFQKEEELALPLLGLLAELARGELQPGAEAAIPLAERLKQELPGMLEEHRQIGVALEELRTAGTQDGSGPALRFVDKLGHHAREEEDVLYPAAILVGECIRHLLGRPRAGRGTGKLTSPAPRPARR